MKTNRYFSDRLDEMLRNGRVPVGRTASPQGGEQPFYDTLGSGWVFCVFAEQSDAAKRRAAGYLAEVLRDADFDKVCRLDREMRDRTSIDWSFNWKELLIDSFFTSDMTEEEKSAVVIFASFHPNGYLRERAVKRIASRQGMLPYIALRLGDWAAPVRRAAQEAFCQKLPACDDRELLAAYPFLTKLRRSERGCYQEVEPLLMENLRTVYGRGSLLRGFTEGTLPARKQCLTMMMQMQPPDMELLRCYYDNEKDPFLRREIGVCMINSAQPAQVWEMANPFLRDPCPKNRAHALRGFYERDRLRAADYARDRLLDKNSLVRTTAQDILREVRPDFDLRGVYINALQENPRVAIAGIGETGGAADCSLIEPYLQSGISGEVQAAAAALMRLHPDGYGGAVTELLLSEEAAVVKAAVRVLARYDGLDFERVCEIACAVSDEKKQYRITRLLCGAMKWPRVIWLLRVRLHTRHEKVLALTEREIFSVLSGYNRFFYVRPTTSQIAQMRELSQALSAQDDGSGQNQRIAAFVQKLAK